MEKILIGCAIHEKKGHLLEKWIANIAKVKSAVDLLLVDSSVGTSFAQHVEKLLKKHNIANYKMEHFEINQEQGMDEMIGRSWEIIRQAVLTQKYDVWFSWDHDLIIEPGIFEKLLEVGQDTKYSIIHQNFGVEKIPIQFDTSFKFTYIRREALEKCGFLLDYPEMPNAWHRIENWFKNKVVEKGGSYVEVYGSIGKIKPKRLKVLIGTAIHEVKDYSIEKWIENASKLKYSSDILLVDNSPGLNFLSKVKQLVKKYKLKNCKIAHLNVAPELSGDRKVEISQEVIRQYILSHDYDAWFSWECDQLIPEDALGKLVAMMNAGDFMMVNHNGWVRGHPGHVNTDFGVSLLARKCLEKYSFLLQTGFDPDFPKNWEPGEVWIKKQVLKGGGNVLEVEGVISPIYHLER